MAVNPRELCKKAIAYVLLVIIVLHMLWKYTVWNWPLANGRELIEKIEKGLEECDAND